MADRLHPKFDSINLNLALLYQKLARTGANPTQRADYARAARDRYVEYVALRYRGRTAPPEVRKNLADLETECAVAERRIGEK